METLEGVTAEGGCTAELGSMFLPFVNGVTATGSGAGEVGSTFAPYVTANGVTGTATVTVGVGTLNAPPLPAVAATGVTGTCQVSTTSGRLHLPPVVINASVITPYGQFMGLYLDPTVLVRSPGMISVRGGGAPPGSSVVVGLIDFPPSIVMRANSAGAYEGSFAVPSGMPIGTHTVKAVAGTLEARASLQIQQLAVPLPDPYDDLVVGAVGANVTRWVFQDPATGGRADWVMTQNPASMTTPYAQPGRQVQAPTVTGAVVFVWTGVPQARTWSFSGTITDQATYTNLVAWADIPHRVIIVDHHRRGWVVTFENMKSELKHKAGYAHLREYTVDCLIHAGPLEVPEV